MKTNWKTTVAGILTAATAGWAIVQDPAQAANPQTLAAIMAAIGLLFAKDAEKTPAK